MLLVIPVLSHPLLLPDLPDVSPGGHHATCPRPLDTWIGQESQQFKRFVFNKTHTEIQQSSEGSVVYKGRVTAVSCGRAQVVRSGASQQWECTGQTSCVLSFFPRPAGSRGLSLGRPLFVYYGA